MSSYPGGAGLSSPSGSEGDWEKILPFVVCSSEGGPFPDEAFVAGFDSGCLFQMMSDGVPSFEYPVLRTLVDQVDLFAMHHGYRVQTRETSVDGPDQADRVWIYGRKVRK